MALNKWLVLTWVCDYSLMIGWFMYLVAVAANEKFTPAVAMYAMGGQLILNTARDLFYL